MNKTMMKNKRRLVFRYGIRQQFSKDELKVLYEGFRYLYTAVDIDSTQALTDEFKEALGDITTKIKIQYNKKS